MSGRLDRLAAAAEGLRRAIGAARIGPLDGPLPAFVDLVRDRSYQVTDAHVEALRAHGLSDDAIFELTVAAAFGIAAQRLDAGLALLDAGPRS